MSMSTSSTKTITDAAYHGAVVGGITIGYGKLAHMVSKSSPDPPLSKSNSGAGAAILYISLAELTRAYLIASGLIPSSITK